MRGGGERMKDYKRLTNNNLEEYNPELDFCAGCKYYGEPNGCNRWNGTCANYERFMETYNRLAELENKIENGTLVELPCKVGDTMYQVFHKTQVEPFPFTVEKMRIIIDAGGIKVYVEEISGKGGTVGGMAFNKAEAEAKLKELKGEE